MCACVCVHGHRHGHELIHYRSLHDVFIAVQHVHQRMSNKNRSHRSHDDDDDHVISNEETITNEVTDPAVGRDHVTSSDHVSSSNDTTVTHNVNNADPTTISNNTDVAISNSADVAGSNNTVVVISNSIGVASSNNTGSPSNVPSNSGDVNVAISSGDVTTDSTWDKREQEYCTTISNMKRTIEALSIKENKLLNDLRELHNKYNSLEESSSQKIAAISSETEQYKIQVEELQRKIDSVTSAKSVSNSQQGADASLPLTPCGDAWKPANLGDIKVCCKR